MHEKVRRKNREEGLEEIARRYLLQPVGGFPPGFMWEEKMRFAYMRTSPTNQERREKVSINVNKDYGPRR